MCVCEQARNVCAVCACVCACVCVCTGVRKWIWALVDLRECMRASCSGGTVRCVLESESMRNARAQTDCGRAVGLGRASGTVTRDFHSGGARG